MRSLIHHVLAHIRRQDLLHAGDRVGVAVSGGIDSVALLRLLLDLRSELGIVLSVVHFNHKLRGAESDCDEQFVASLAREHDLEFHAGSDDVARLATEEHVSVEAAARELRYGSFRRLLGEDGSPDGLKPSPLATTHGTANAVPIHESRPLRGESNIVAGSSGESGRVRLNKIATGHTLDDQAETVLMRLIRGAGMRGLGGIYPRIVVEDVHGELCGEIIRPLLATRHCELEQYLREIGQPWRDDATNRDSTFTRNRVRHLVVPLLENEFNPGVAENLAELAEVARDEEDYWENEVAGWMGTAVHWAEPDWVHELSKQSSLVQIEPSSLAAQRTLARDDNESKQSDLRSRIDNARWLVMNASVDRLWFLGEPVAVQRRVIKAIGDHAGISLEFKHVEECLRFAAEGEPGKELSLPRGWKLVREPDELVFVTPDLREKAPAQDYDYELTIPGRVFVKEIGSFIEARRVSTEAEASYNPEHLLDADSLPGPLRVRNWRAGDRFWPAHTKSPRKIKELLHERHVSQPDRRLWPVVTSGNEIVWMRGFSSPAKFLRKAGHDAILISEVGSGAA